MYVFRAGCCLRGFQWDRSLVPCAKKSKRRAGHKSAITMYAYSALLNAVNMAGAAVIVDVSPGSYCLDPLDFPTAERLADTTLSVPLYPALTDAEINQVASALRNFNPWKSKKHDPNCSSASLSSMVGTISQNCACGPLHFIRSGSIPARRLEQPQ